MASTSAWFSTPKSTRDASARAAPKKRAARGKAWDDDDVAWGLGYRDDDDDDYDFAAGAYADADGVDDIESWNAAVSAAREERAAAADLASAAKASSPRAGALSAAHWSFPCSAQAQVAQLSVCTSLFPLALSRYAKSVALLAQVGAVSLGCAHAADTSWGTTAADAAASSSSMRPCDEGAIAAGEAAAGEAVAGARARRDRRPVDDERSISLPENLHVKLKSGLPMIMK